LARWAQRSALTDRARSHTAAAAEVEAEALAAEAAAAEIRVVSSFRASHPD
jgi:hypothetical protein